LADVIPAREKKLEVVAQNKPGSESSKCSSFIIE